MPTILLVEDNSVDAELISEAFGECCDCLTLTIAGDGEAALDMLHNKGIPHLVLLDLNLPKRNGLEVLQEVRADQDPRISTLPVVILTNSRSSQDIIRAHTHHCNAFVQKPMGYEGLLDVVQKIGAFWFHCVSLPTSAFGDTIQPPSS